VVDQINADLNSLLAWGEDNRTTFEPTKTHSMLVSLKRSDRFKGLDKIHMGGVVLEQVSQMKLVGFVFDSKLSWGPMVDRLAAKSEVEAWCLAQIEALSELRGYEADVYRLHSVWHGVRLTVIHGCCRLSPVQAGPSPALCSEACRFRSREPPESTRCCLFVSCLQASRWQGSRLSE
jgi:hypothetical protein